MVREAHHRLASGPASREAWGAGPVRHQRTPNDARSVRSKPVRQGAITVIAGCWIAWLVVWIVMAFSTKRTVERSSRWWPSISVTVIFLVWVRLQGRSGSIHHALWAPSTPVSVLSVALVIAGLAFTVWARLTLGANWSGAVTFKQDHELVERGPYALVRHPIYTGLLAMMLGTALIYAEAFGLVLFGAGVVVLFLKSRTEEQLMTSHFPDEYPSYRRRVKALIPYVL
jgi:protein-S-isoprenylcysteine O-methyltransferase Ste14